MAKTKISVSLDPSRLERARSLVATNSVSELIEVALARLIDEEADRQHVDGYLRMPVDSQGIGWDHVKRVAQGDDIDWAKLYGVSPR